MVCYASEIRSYDNLYFWAEGSGSRPLAFTHKNPSAMFRQQQGTAVMELARLVLDYLKILVWPLLIGAGLYLFSPEIRERIGKVESLGMGPGVVKFATGSARQEEGRREPHPALWLNLARIRLSQRECLDKAHAVLGSSGFSGLQQNNEMSVSGDAEGYAGIIWCLQEWGVAFFVVAGPNRDMAQKRVNDMVTALEIAAR
jgi:hypothetical protein